MIVLMRHAHTEGGQGCCIGRTALELSEKGRVRADEAAHILRRGGFVRLCCSPSRRAVSTLSPLCEQTGLPADVIGALDEIDMGEWDGMSFAEIRAQHPLDFERRGKNFATFRPPRGESFNDVADRAMLALKQLSSGPLPLLAVTHAGVIRSVLCRATGHPLDDLFHFSPRHLECSVLRFSEGVATMLATNLSPDAVVEMLGR